MINKTYQTHHKMIPNRLALVGVLLASPFLSRAIQLSRPKESLKADADDATVVAQAAQEISRAQSNMLLLSQQFGRMLHMNASNEFFQNMIESECARTQECHAPTTELALFSEILHSNQKHRQWIASSDLYEFGVYTGVSLGKKLATLTSTIGAPRHVWAFDSFQGVPTSVDNSQSGWLTVDSFSLDALDFVRQNINFKNSTLIKGFYNVSLTRDLPGRYDMKPAWWVNIDCDVYISTLQALDWMFARRLMQKGTRVYYDDVFLYPLGTAEMQAHKEITEKYNVIWKSLLSFPHWQQPESHVTYLWEVVDYEGM